jgi:predicted metalloendopeptidase
MKPDQSREYDQYYTNTTLDNIYKEMNKLNSLPRKQDNYDDTNKDFKLNEETLEKSGKLFEELYNHFNFRNILEKNFVKNFASCENPPNKYHITAFDGDAIRRCMELILNTNNYEKYRSYMQYQIIKSFQGFCTKELDEEFFDFYSRKLGGQQEQKSYVKRSINIVNAYAGEMLGKLFVNKYFPKDSKNEMEKLVNNVLSIMDDSLKNNDWLTVDTKEKAVAKLTTFRSKIGYPNVWKDYSDFDIQIGDSLYDISKKAKKWSLRVNFFDKLNSILDREEWRMTPQTVNAYFMPTQNEIVFPAAILQPPFFHQSRDTIDFNIDEEINMVANLDVVTPANYGGIGAVISHEITHGYDDKGRKFDGDGNLNDWWKEEDGELFKKKTEIMVNSVSNYVYIDEENKKEYKMNAQLTMGENLADIGGLSLSMKALLKKLSQENSSEIVIKASLRVFFKSWANVWKQNIKKDKRIMLLNVDPHAPTDFRGNLVQHMDEFYDAFNIKEDQNMYLDKENRMKMW